MKSLQDKAVELLAADLIARLAAGEAEARAQLEDMIRKSIAPFALTSPAPSQKPWPEITPNPVWVDTKPWEPSTFPGTYIGDPLHGTTTCGTDTTNALTCNN